MDQNETYEALATLAWQVELGADEAIQDTPINRFEASKAPEVAQSARPPAVPAKAAMQDAVVEAKRAAANAKSLEDLKEAISSFELCELKKGARNTVFADGNPAARAMIIGEAPGRDEDIEGRPFVGRAGRLLDRMLAAIDMDRAAPDSEGAV